MPTEAVRATRNYRLFESHDPENRIVEPLKHKALLTSMKQYGFLRSFPIVAVRDKKGHLRVKDGQHRLFFAEQLGLPVYFVVADEDFDVAVVNSTPRVWVVGDFARKHAANGNRAYQEGLEFANAHHLPIGIAFALLSGTTTYRNIQVAFQRGEWKPKDRAWADAVAGIYSSMVQMAPVMRNVRFLAACMAACRVGGFDGTRLIANAKRCRERLVAYSTRDAYLDMMEYVYNYGRKELVGLKAAAQMAMKERSVAKTR